MTILIQYLQFWMLSRALEKKQNPESFRLSRRSNCGGITRTWFSNLGSMSYVYFSDFLSEQLRLNANTSQDMDLLNDNRSLVHTGKFLRQPDTGFEWNGWTELFALLFDNYRGYFTILSPVVFTNSLIVLMTKPKEKDGITKYQVYRRASLVSHETTKFLTCPLAHTPRPFDFGYVHGPSYTTRWRTITFRWWKKGN